VVQGDQGGSQQKQLQLKTQKSEQYLSGHHANSSKSKVDGSPKRSVAKYGYSPRTSEIHKEFSPQEFDLAVEKSIS
jgi:hypothetical protein